MQLNTFLVCYPPLVIQFKFPIHYYYLRCQLYVVFRFNSKTSDTLPLFSSRSRGYDAVLLVHYTDQTLRGISSLPLYIYNLNTANIILSSCSGTGSNNVVISSMGLVFCNSHPLFWGFKSFHNQVWIW